MSQSFYIEKFIMALFNKMESRREESLQVLLESDIIFLVGKYSRLGNFSGRNTF